MENENKQDAPQVDLSQLEGKFQEKFNAQEQQLERLYASQRELVELLSQSKAPKSEGQLEHQISDLLLSDPDKAIEVLTKRIKSDIETNIQKQNQATAEQNQVLIQLQNDFPELAQADHPLTKSALEVYGKMSNKEKESPLAYEAAVAKAALKTGIKPKSLRSQSENDDFSLSGRNGGPKHKSDKLDKGVLEFAKKMGLDTSDPKVLDSLKKRIG